MLHTATRRPSAGYTPAITGPVTRGAYEHSRAAANAATTAELTAAAEARVEAASAAGRARVVVQANTALAEGDWTLAARLFSVAAGAVDCNVHGHADAVIAALLRSAKLAAGMASPGPSRGERMGQMAALLRASA